MLGRRGLVAVHAARTGKHDPPHAGFPGHVEQRDGAGDTRGIRIQRRVHASRHRSQCRLVEDDFDAFDGPLNIARIDQVAFNEVDLAAQAR